MERYDYIVVGAGSAGCVVAARLVEAGRSVLLVEAGGRDRDPRLIPPAGVASIMGRYAWKFATEPEAGVDHRRLAMSQGRIVGGGSAINGMICIRGQPQDYDGWAADGCAGWDWGSVLPVFRRIEANQRLSGPYHGIDGPLRVADNPYRHPLSYAFVKAAQEVGLPWNDDFNGLQQIGVGFYQLTAAGGRRQSAAVAFLSRVIRNPLLTLHTDATVAQIDFENGAASGITYRAPGGGEKVATARSEVVLCAGALGSPRLLQLSGIGPGRLLADFAIPVVRDLPVGENFQDHFQTAIYAQTREPISLLGHNRGLRLARHAWQWGTTRSGLLASNLLEAGGFADTTGAGRADIQFHFLPMLSGDADRPPLPGHGATISPCLLRPRARGSVRIASRDPDVPVEIVANALSHPDDLDTLVRGLALGRQMLRAPSLARVVSRELAPGPHEGTATRAALEAHVRRTLKTVYHPAGTCRMGIGAAAVVDPMLRVHGVPRLRVADMSICPTIVSGNTNVPAMMIGDRCADFLLGAK